MTPERKKELSAHWVSRGMRWARERYVADRKRFPLFLILDAAIMPAPLFEGEPWFVRPTQSGSSLVGGVVRWNDETHRGKHLETVVMIPGSTEARRINVGPMQLLVDNLGDMFEALAFTSDERAQCLDKVSAWITHDDTADDAKDETAWNERLKLRAKATEISQRPSRGKPLYD